MTFSVDTDLGPMIIPTLPEDTMLVANRLDAMVELLREIKEATYRQEQIAPTLLDILTFNGCIAGERVGLTNTSVRLRTQWVIPLVTLTTTVMSLMVGTNRVFTVRVNTGASTTPFPLPITIEPGVDITAEIETAQAAGGRAGFYIIAFPEKDRPDR